MGSDPVTRSSTYPAHGKGRVRLPEFVRHLCDPVEHSREQDRSAAIKRDSGMTSPEAVFFPASEWQAGFPRFVQQVAVGEGRAR
jgi:hypothetical protein